jgi:hypothetical protein
MPPPNGIKTVRDGSTEGAHGLAGLLPQFEGLRITLHTEFGELYTRIRDAWIQVRKTEDLNLKYSWGRTGDSSKTTKMLV